MLAGRGAANRERCPYRAAMCNAPTHDLQPTIALFTRYLTVFCKDGVPNEADAREEFRQNRLLGGEALTRLEQMQFLLRRVATIQQRVIAEGPIPINDLLLPLEPRPSFSNTTDDGHNYQQIFFHVRLYTETFYYVAFRFWAILTKQKKNTDQYALPHLKAFRSDGVVCVRNQLLEHPDGKKAKHFQKITRLEVRTVRNSSWMNSA